ncbi:class I SAM-dependent methyltransferase [Microvirga antarctica]|uniref:class I SAM-dependent methyltransferase n=1 Tax=Microvirga antarctica TaxID=2819233 RepID=UPI001B309012|nr:class I SAM-dependent methyltransferase [Microvirga antarctica]
MDFNETKQTYRDTIEQSIAFAGKGLDFFTSVKADYLHRIVQAELPGLDKPRLLDVGCGHGYIHPDLRRFGFDIVGVEVATEVLPFAREANPDVTYLGYDGTTLPFEDDSFDVAMAICVMHHVPPEQWPNFSREMHRVLRPGGIVAIFEHNPINPLTRYVVSRNEIDDDAVLLSTSTLRGLLKDAGFQQVATRNILFTPFASPFFRAVDRQLGWCPFGAQYYAVGKVV